MARAKTKPVDPLDMAMEMLADKGWRAFSMAELAMRAGMSLDELYAQFPTQGAILQRMGSRLDAAMLGGDLSHLAEMNVRERLFDLWMRRFDAMLPWRPAFSRLARQAGRDPGLSMRSLCNLDRMAQRLADVAGIRLAGLAGRAARGALVMAYLRSFRVWLDDESEDMAATMAELDRNLAALERVAGLACRIRRAPKGTGEEQAA